ncbi:MAG: hypothetical protein J0L92_01450 [Deltaproteobacteria bacterium]|nr:hypothetical protein [Deltaproteobacteria bacterium]
MPRVFCRDGGWVYGTHVPIRRDSGVYCAGPDDRVPCNQLECEQCSSPVKHVEGVKVRGRWSKAGLAVLYDSSDPQVWLDDVDTSPEYRLYLCRCCWYSTPGANPVGHLDTKDIDHWACAGHPSDASD